MTALPYLDLSYGTQMSQDYRVKRINYGDGYSQRAADGLNAQPQTWQLVYERIPDATAEELRVFFAGLGGTALIDWTPYGQSVELRWSASGFTSKPSGTAISDVAVTLTQEFDL